MKLRNFDLNLLVILESVLSEASITRAAKRLNLSQPAVSQALARARDLFGDELLVRDGAQMMLTPLARRLAPQLKDFCLQAEGLLSPVGFNPGSAEIDFTVSANDLSELLILPRLIADVARLAPGCRVIVRAPEPYLINATIDFAIIGLPVPQGPFTSRDLHEDHFVVIARPGHPAMSEQLSAETFAGLSHALVSPTGQGIVGPIDVTLERLGLSRRVALSVTRFTTLPQIVASTDLIASVPSRFALRPEVHSLCQVCELPFASPRFTMRMVWHQMHDTDPAHQWLRGLL
jgi:DNA-binding transcriptional LysR family regulator